MSPHATPPRPIDEQLEGRNITPMLEQFAEAKRACPVEAILLFRMGDFYELFFDDAIIASQELDLNLTTRDRNKPNPIPMAGVPHHAVRGYIQRLVDKGYTVAMCDQVEDPKDAKGIVRREITRLVTPGTVTDLEALDPGSANYTAYVTTIDDTFNVFIIAFVDMLAGEVLVTSCSNDLALGLAKQQAGPSGGGADLTQVMDELLRMSVREVLVSEDHMAAGLLLAATDISPAVRVLSPEELPQRQGSVLRLRERFATASYELLELDLAALATRAGIPEAPETQEAVAAAIDVVVGYLEHTQRRKLRHLSPPRAYMRTDHLVLDEATRRNLELVRTTDGQRKGSLLWHIDRCSTALGSRTLAQWLLFPLREMKPILSRQDDVARLRSERTTRQEARVLLREVRDIERLMGRLAVGRTTPKDLSLLRASLMVIPRLAEVLFDLGGTLGDDWKEVHRADAVAVTDIAALLQKALVEEPPVQTAAGGYMAIGYDAALDEVLTLCTSGHDYLFALEERERERTGIRNLKVRYNKVFGYYIEVSKAQLASVPDNYVRKQTLVNAERFVVDELNAYAAKVLSADEKRRHLELELFDALVAEVAKAIPRLRALSRLLARTDALMSLAQVADEDNLEYTRPALTDEPVVQLSQARHPVVERLMPGGERFVPNDIDLDARTRQLLVVTGPNMAGKSTVMRQVALCTVLAHMGAFVPARSARIGLSDRLFTRVGASDNLGRGHSTFMVEMVETATILREATAQSLVILDEVGRGTSTFDGVSIAWAVAEHLHNVTSCRAMFATHYHELTALSDTCKRVVNVSIAVKEAAQGVVFLRRLVEGKADRSYGIEVAKLAGLPDSVLRRARTMLERMQEKAPRSGAYGIAAAQLGLFGAESDVPPERDEVSPSGHDSTVNSKIAEMLGVLDIGAMTPVQALNYLDRLQIMLKEDA